MAINTVINTNMMALTAHRNLGTVGNRQNKANQRLSSGKKINSAADDAAGLAISEKMKAQIRGLDMASKNSEDAISLIQTAEGSLTEVNDMLTRVRELTVQAANDTNQKEDRVKIAEEVAQLLTEIDSIADRTEFNEKKLNDGSFQDGHFQIGANGGQSLDLSIGNMNVKGIGLDGVMETFGVEGGGEGAYITATIRKPDGSIVGSTEKNAVAHQVKSGDIASLTNGKAYTFELTYRNSKGEVKTVKSNEITAQDNKNAENIANAFSGIEFDGFTIKGNGKTVTFQANEAGADGKFEIIGINATKVEDGSSTTIADINKTITKGDNAHVEYEVGNDGTHIQKGGTITVGGKTYKHVDGTDKIKDPSTEFSNKEEFEKLLAKDGIEVKKGSANTKMKFVKKNKGYMVSGDKVSDKGADYSESLRTIDKALKNVTTQRAKLGANQNRLEYTIKNLNLSSENLNAARSRIEDTDMAKEMMNLTSANVLQQAATSILAQANQAPNNITQLLG